MACKGYVNCCVCVACLRRSSSHNTATIRNREVRAFVERYMTPHGFRRVGEDSKGRPQFECAFRPGVLVTVPQTPGDSRWSKNLLAELRRVNPQVRSDTGKRRPAPPAVPHADLHDLACRRLSEHAHALGVPVSDRQAGELLTAHGGPSAARTFLNRLVAAQRRSLAA